MKNIMITGATGGIGGAIVKKFHSNGYNVCATGSNIEKLDKLAACYDNKIKCIQCNLSDNEQIKNLVKQASEYYGSTNILINNAGITRDGLAMRMNDEDWKEVIDINLNSTFILTKLILKDMVKSKWGRIINITSDAAKIGNPGQANYVASKSAVEGLTRTLANEVASRGITVNSISPGFIKTDILESLTEQKLNQMLNNVPMNKIGVPDDISSAVFFLSSQESSYITGQVLHVNGGLTM